MTGPNTEDWERPAALVEAEHRARLETDRAAELKGIATARWEPAYQPTGPGKLPELLVGLDGSVLARFIARDHLADQWHVLHAGVMLLGASRYRCGPGTVVPGEMVFTAPGVPSWQVPVAWSVSDYRVGRG
jgi:hypothetical protein